MSASPAKAKKAAKPRKPAAHPKYIEMIQKAISELKERGGSSRVKILKYIIANFKVEPASANQHLKMALRNGVKSGSLKQTKGVGAAGSFRVGEKKVAKKPKKKVVKKAKKPKKAAKKPAGEKKAAKPKKPAAKVKKPKTPKKAKAPAAKKAAKPKAKPAKKAAKKSPKKAAKKAAKK